MEHINEVLQAARSGDQRSIEALMRHFNGDVWAVCFNFQIDQENDISIADLTQEIWLKVWLQLPQFKGDTDDDIAIKVFRGWIRKTAGTVVTNILAKRRAKKRRPDHQGFQAISPIQDSASPGIDPPERDLATASLIASNAELQKHIRMALAKIDETSRQIIELCFFECKPLNVAAAELNLNRQQARRRLNAAVKQLKTYLDLTNF